MRLLSSLRSRIFLTSALLTVLSLGVATYIVSVNVTNEAENALQRDITATGRVVEQLRTRSAETYTTMAQLIADEPKLKAAAATNDPPTVQDEVAKDYQAQFKSSLLLVTGKTGSVLATVGASPRAAQIVASQPSVHDALAGRVSVSLLPWPPDGMLQLVTVPITIGLKNPEMLGTLSVGFLLDDAFANQMKEGTGSELAFGMDGQVLATTLPAADRGQIAELLRRTERSATVTLGDEDYAASAPLPLSAVGDSGVPGAGPMALILRSRSETQRFLRSIHTQLVLTLVVAVLLATLLSFAVARTITQPLAAITTTMREVASTGDLTRKVVFRGSQRWNDEDARILATTFNTLTDSIARFQVEMSQKERLSSLGRLSTVIAHEVRNPLMIIKAALHTLRQAGVTHEEVREAASDIDEEIARLNRIVNEVLDFARPIQFDLAPADLNGVCRESAAAAQVTPGAQVGLDLDDSSPVVTTDAERLRSALVNLIVNARHAMESTAGDSRVLLSTRVTDGTVSIVVADRGTGITDIDLGRVFDPYFTTRRGGTGLGLPIAKNIIEGLGGAITVSSVAGRGTEMRIELPFRSKAS
ncbi:MAG TPA: ATP-binding protein [Vicinamibacterales bacterium]|nr:ATP-binding protein [Vicinamibacterales bacterium]